MKGILDILERYSGKKSAWFLIYITVTAMYLPQALDPALTEAQASMYKLFYVCFAGVTSFTALGQGIADLAKKGSSQ